MNNKGFTLVELLGVIILLSLIALITIPSISSWIKEGEEKANNQIKENIVLASKNWALDNKNLLPQNTNQTYKVTLNNLQNGGYIDKNLKLPSTGNELENICVIITNTGKTTKGLNKYKYEYSENC